MYKIKIEIKLNQRKEKERNSIGTKDYKQGDLESDEYRPKKALSLADSESLVILPDKHTHIYTHNNQCSRTNQQMVQKRGGRQVRLSIIHTLNSM